MVSNFVEQCGRALHLQERTIPKALAGGSETETDIIQDKRLIVLTGCGDSYAVAEYGAWALLQEGFNALAMPAPDVRRIHLDERCLVIGITASGRSLATIDAVKVAAHQGAHILALTDNGQGEINNVVEDRWLTETGVETYDIIPTAPTTAAMAFLLGVAGQLKSERYERDLQSVKREMGVIFHAAEGEGRVISELISTEQKAYFISEGPNFVAAQLGMMKMNETSLTQGIAVQREEFQHYGSLPTQEGDLAVLIADTPTTERDIAFVRVLWERLGLRSYHLHAPSTPTIETPLAQALVNTITLQFAVYHALRRYAPEKEWFRLPHARAFKIY
ncbi:MAG: SIS domain-containing protein [Candidatus Thorarchaeota archaeon]|nr:SIS domain-containing protein [Candidatus Thorarchaeota archaeon]